MTPRIYLALFTVIVVSLSACQPDQRGSIVKPDNQTELAAAAASLKSADYLSAAQQYNSLAIKSSGDVQAQYYLRAALAFWQAEDVAQSQKNLDLSNYSLLSQQLQFDSAILQAQLALHHQQAEQALTALEHIDPRSLFTVQYRQLLSLQIQAYGLTQNWLEKANNHIRLAALIDGNEAKQNQQALWQSLMALTAQSLELYNPGIPPAIESGWFELAYIVKSYQSNFDTFSVAIENWQRNYPNHPADADLYQQDLASASRLPSQLHSIAVLLPESGRFNKAANAIKQGIITAHFHAQSDAQLHFYPINEDGNNVIQQYQQAVADKASIVIGPLAKKSVQMLADGPPLTVPVLALNRLAEQSGQAQMFQFGLAPEDDAIAIANYATAHNYQRGVILSANNDWGRRTATAFEQQWSDNLGVLLNHAFYDPADNDFSAIIKPLLGLEASKQRYQSLQRALAYKLEFEPRRRQDIDFIFLAAKPLKARQLVPQLKFHRSGILPIIATSQAFSGQENAQQDIDLNKLIISDIPWIFADHAEMDPVYNSLKLNRPQHFQSYVRLYALGADAYRLLPELNRLSHSSDSSFSGASGQLSINSDRHIKRETSWGVFDKGLLIPLTEN